jgi:hypothetical protein
MFAVLLLLERVINVLTPLHVFPLSFFAQAFASSTGICSSYAAASGITFTSYRYGSSP